MRISVLVIGLAALSACAEAPLSNAEIQRREAALQGGGTGPGLAATTEQKAALIASKPSAITTQAIGADIPPNPLVQIDPNAAQPRSGISDEQDFGAVSARETIESDAARRARLAAEYQVVQTGNLPTRTEGTGPNIVRYALQTTNLPGQKIYSRFLPSQNKMIRNCSQFSSDDGAQRAFLTRGGPEIDRLGMDPDGDGFACNWDPRQFRAAAGN